MSYLKALHRAAVSVAAFLVMTFGSYAAPTPEPAKALPIDAILNHIRLDFLFQGSNSSVSGNQVYASPDGSGGQLLMRSLVLGDLPRGASGQCITGTGTSSAPSYQSCAAGFGSLTPGTNTNAGTFVMSGNALDWSATTQVRQRVSAGLTTSATGDCGFDSTANMWHCWDGVDNFNLLMPATLTPTNNDLVTHVVSGGQFKLGKISPVGGGTNPLFVSGVGAALNGDFVRQNNSGVWTAATPGVLGRAAATATEPIVWTSGTGDRGALVTFTNGSLVTSAIPQCGVGLAVNNPFTSVWGTGAGGFKLTSTTSTLNGVAGATGITYPGLTWGQVVCDDNANYRVLAARAVKAGTNATETLNADGTVSINVPAGGVSRLDQITAATASATALANGNFFQSWNYAPTTDSQAAHTFGETSAATNGTITGATANQSILKASTATNSTATPLNVVQGQITNTVATPGAEIQCSWNNGSLVGKCLVVSVTSTAANGGSNILELFGGAAGATSEFSVRNNGDTTGNTFKSASGIYEASAQGTTTSFLGGLDSATAGVLGPFVGRGADSSSTTAASAGGTWTGRGGDETGATANAEVGGTWTGRGGNVASTGVTSTPGAASLTGGGFTGAATNAVGADVTISGGLGTGTGTPSHVIIRGPGFGAASGSTAQTQVTRFVVHAKAGSTTTATATNMFQIALANNQTGAARVHVHVETTQATPHNCSSSSEFFIDAQDTAGTITTNVSSAVGTATICDTGTLTMTLAASGAAPSVISVTPSWTTIVPSAVIITVGIENLSQQDIALL